MLPAIITGLPSQAANSSLVGELAVATDPSTSAQLNGIAILCLISTNSRRLAETDNISIDRRCRRLFSAKSSPFHSVLTARMGGFEMKRIGISSNVATEIVAASARTSVSN